MPSAWHAGESSPSGRSSGRPPSLREVIRSRNAVPGNRSKGRSMLHLSTRNKEEDVSTVGLCYSFAFVLTKLQPSGRQMSSILDHARFCRALCQSLSRAQQTHLSPRGATKHEPMFHLSVLSKLSSLLPSAHREVHRIVASCTASAHARSYSSRLIHSSIVCGSFCPAPKVTVGTP